MPRKKTPCPQCGQPHYATSALCRTCHNTNRKPPPRQPKQRKPKHACAQCGQPCDGHATYCRTCYEANLGKGISGNTRKQLGCLITFENQNREHLTLHDTGNARESVRRMCDRALQQDTTYRIISYSTAETILTDITGGRADVTDMHGHDHPQALPEVKVAGTVGVRHMLHPRLEARTNRKRAERNPYDHRSVQ